MQIIIEHTTNPIVIICSDFDGVSVTKGGVATSKVHNYAPGKRQLPQDYGRVLQPLNRLE